MTKDEFSKWLALANQRDGALFGIFKVAAAVNNCDCMSPTHGRIGTDAFWVCQLCKRSIA